MVEGLAERHTLIDDTASFLMTRGRGAETGTQRMHFPEFIQKYGREYRHGSPEYDSRKALFESRLADIERHNAQRGRSWKASVNHLTDRTDEELRRLRGYRRGARAQVGAGAGLVGASAVQFDLSRLPAQFTWKGVLQATSSVRDQGQCGSCWAFAAGTVMRAHSELFQHDHPFSLQQIVSCTPNPQECGGRGGCTGATAELAMDYVSKVGSLAESDMPYTATELACPTPLKSHSPLDASTLEGPALHEMFASESSAASLGLTGFRKLAENQLEPVLMSLYEEGPLSVSIAAGNGWNMYSSGIYDSCQNDIIIDHAVMLVGWGEEDSAKFWQIQNSWGPTWGEDGYIRVIRHNHQAERGHCGWDNEPSIGSGCKGGPSRVWICGSCGILYDVVVPTFNLGNGSWWAEHGRNVSSASTM